tara:strand:- start:1248 stop:2366 length:1119 start_codon:yes stop_codon:yes gene_type:complete
MNESFYSLGLMSGTSMDGVDASIIHSDGIHKYTAILNKYFEYDENIYQKLINIRNRVGSSKDLKNLSNELKTIEKEITLFHVNVVNKIMNESNVNINFIGFHGQTIFHNAAEKITKQLGDGVLLSQLTKKVVVFNFRKNDLENEGQGAPLSPIFHKLIVEKKNIDFPICVLNIGGISNITYIGSKKSNSLKSYDIGPGNCLIDEWIRKKAKKKYDKNGDIAKLGKTHSSILKETLDNFYLKKNIISFDVKDFSTNFVNNLSLEDGASTLTDFTGKIIGNSLYKLGDDNNNLKKILICGGGRKNISLINSIKKNSRNRFIIQSIDDIGEDGDFIESQAFAYLAIRSYLKLPISFPETTGCKSPISGGVIVGNF